VLSRVRFLGTALIFSLGIFALSCSSGSSSSTKSGGGGTQTGLQFTAPKTNPSIDAGQTVTLTVNEPVTWTLQAFGNVQGKLVSPSSTSVTYQSPDPSTVFASLQVSVVATLVSDPTQAAIMPVLVNPALAVGGQFSANTNCAYDPLNTSTGASASNATVGSAFSGHSAPGVSGGTAPFTWTVASGTLPPGLTLGIAPSTSSVYFFGTPSAVGCSTFSLTVTDATGVSATTSVNNFIVTLPNLSAQGPTIPNAYAGVPFPPFAIVVSGGTPPYRNWQISPNGDPLPTGMTFTVDPTNSAVVIVSGTPSQTQGSVLSPTFRVEDSQSPYPALAVGGAQFVFPNTTLPANSCQPAQGGSATNTNQPAMKGSYAFLLHGFDANGPVVMAGSFAADGAGNITGGVEDVMRTTGSQTGAIISGGSYSLIQQNDTNSNFFAQAGCLMLTTSAGTTQFAVSMGGCTTGAQPGSDVCNTDAQMNPGIYTTGRLSESDDSTGTGTRGSGILRLQDSTAFGAGLSGSYAFGLSGWDPSASGGRFAAAGSFKASSGSLSAVAADINDAGNFQSQLSGGSGSFSALDTTTGRGTASMSVGLSTLSTLAVYAVSSTEVIVANTGTPGATNPVIGGEAISTAASFAINSMQNSHMFRTGGAINAGSDANIGLLQFDGSGNFSGIQYEDQAATLSTTSLSGTYTIDSASGRIQLGAPSQILGDHPLVGYVIPSPTARVRQDCVKLSSCVTAFVVSTDASAQAGQLEFQTPTNGPPPPFSKLFIAGYYFFGTDEGLDAAASFLTGSAKANPTASSYAGIQSASYGDAAYCREPNCALLLPNEGYSAGYSVSSNGSGTIGGETVSVTNGNVTFYLDESPLNFHPEVIVVEQ